MSDFKFVHYNPAQIRCLLQYPKKLVAIMGRGTGKSTGIIAPRIANCVVKMPRSNNGLVAKTYKQIKSRTLPATKSGWNKLGFREWDPKKGGHFTIGAKNKNFPMPSEAPDDWEHVIHWFTGAIVSMSSQDRKNDSNGLNLQSLHSDESKLLDYEDLTESIIPTLRGLPGYKNLIEYRMLTFTSDMPTTPEGKWLLDAEHEMDPETTDLIFQFQIMIQQMRDQLTKTQSPSMEKRLQYEISSLQNKIHYLRNGDFDANVEPHTYFAEASSFDNIDMLTPEYIKIQKRNLPDFIFQTSILNRRPVGVEISKMFYPQLSAKHFYTAYNYNYLDSFLELPDDKDTCLGDADVKPDYPLDLLIDWGGNINSLIAAQPDDDKFTYNYLKEFFALAQDGEYIKHAIDKFCNYYSPHSTKTVYLYYDRNGNTKVANSDESFAEYAARLLYERSWTVYLMTYEENPNHSDKYEFFVIALSGNEHRLPNIKINSGNCPNLEIALYNAKNKRVGNEIKKDKSSEDPRSPIPMVQATHITDAFDYGYYARYRLLMEGSLSSFQGIIMG